MKINLRIYKNLFYKVANKFYYADFNRNKLDCIDNLLLLAAICPLYSSASKTIHPYKISLIKT